MISKYFKIAKFSRDSFDVLIKYGTVIMAFILFGTEIEYGREKSRLNKNLKITLEFFMTESSFKSYSIRS